MEKINYCAIIAEYNPFHNGHLYHIKKTKEKLGDIPLICIMSGHFTQRGEPTIVDKWTRAQWAIDSGFDLVIELPVIYSVQSANRFAGGSVNIIKGLEGISDISFGSETENVYALQQIAKYRKTPEYSARLNKYLKDGNTYARAHQYAISTLNLNDDLLFDNPNSILGIEYLGFLEGTHIKPTIIKRTKNSHNDTELLDGITSATSIRKALLSGYIDIAHSVPEYVADTICTNNNYAENYFEILLSKIYSLKAEGLHNIHEVTEGLENRIYQEALKARSLTELLDNIKTKRYLYVRLQRIMTYILLDISKDFMKKIDNSHLPVYARILAINTKNSVLSNLNPQIPIISKVADYDKRLNDIQKEIFEKDLLATNLYSIFSDIRPNEDFIHQIIKKA